MSPSFSVWPVDLFRFALTVAAIAFAIAATAEPLPVRALAPGVYVIPGASGEPSAANLGRVINTGFIVGDDAVIVIDSGANQNHGLAILAAVARITDKPVKLLINTHPSPNYVLGNAPFAARGVPILSTAATAAAMQERCPRCIEHLTTSVGHEAMQGTAISLPQRRIETSQRLTIGGRTLSLLYFGHARTEGDLAVLDETSGVVFAGDLVYRDQIRHFAEARFSGWIAALDQLARQPIRILVPGRGEPGDLSALVRMRTYLQQLYDLVGMSYRDGRSPDETLARADLPAFAGLPGYAENHPLNVQRAYFEYEADELARPESSN